MKKTVFTKITTAVMMLVLFVALAVGLSVASAAEVQAQAQWSADATSEPIGSGTLQEAFDAAAAENSTVGYIRVLSDIDLGDKSVKASGGAFTLDLNGKTVTSTTYTVYLENAVDIIITDTSSEKSGRLESTNSNCAAIVVNDDTAVNITVEGGTVEGGAYAIMLSNGLHQPTAATLTVSGGKLIAGSSVIEASGASVTVSGGEFESVQANIDWVSGVVDLSAHPAPAGMTVCNYTDIDVLIPSENIKLPAGYGFYFYDEWVNTLAMNYTYTIDLIRHNVSLSVGANGQATLSPEGEKLAQNTTVTLTVTPDEGYTVDEINVEGATYDAQSNTFTVGEQDVAVTVTFKLYQAEWGTGQDHLTEKGSLREALDAAAADDSVTYIKLVESITDRDVAMLVSSGTFTLDLGGRTLTSSNSIALVLSEGVSVTLTDTVGGGQLLATYYAPAVLMEPNSRLTVSQGSFWISGDSSDIHMKEGAVLRLTDYENVDGLCLYSEAQEAHVGMHVVLPDGYSVYQEDGGDAVATLQNGAKHTVDLTRYSVSWEISGAYLNATPGVEWIAHGTTVTFTIEPYDYHEIVSVSINEGEVEYTLDPDTGIYSFEMPMQDVCVTAQIKHNAFTWGESANTMTQTGDFYDLALAMNASDKTLYAKLLDDVYVILPQQGVTVNGKVVIALNYHSFEAFFESVIALAQGADVTFLEDVEPDDPILLRAGENQRVSAVFELQEGASLTFDGARATASVLYRGGELDISGAHWASSVDLYNATDGEVLISDFVTLGERFRAIDYEALYENGGYHTTIPKKEKMEKEDNASLEAIFTGSFDFGEGSGTATSIELLFQEEFRIPKFENVSHPEGLVLNGWRYESDLNAQTFDRYFYMTALADVTFEAVWGAPVYVGGVGLFDGDYLKAGATETTKVRPAAGGYAYFKDGVLTLKDYTFQGQGSVFEVYEDDGDIYESYALILASEDVIIELVGENKLTNGYDDYSYGIYGSGTVTIRGEGSLWLDTNDDGVYAKHFKMENGTVHLISGDDAFIVDSLTVSGGTLISLSWYGVYRSQSVSIMGGEFYVLSLDDGEGEVAVCTESFTMDGGLLVIKGDEGIVANYITVNGGRIEIEAENDVIRNNDNYYDGLSDDAFLTVNGGVISLYSEYEDGIDFVGAVTVSGGELSIDAIYGVYVWDGAFTISGGEIYISGYDASIYVSGGGTFTISGGEVDLYGAVYADGESAIAISGATVYLSGDVIAQDDSTFTLGGKSTAIVIYGALPEGEAFVLNEQEIKRIFADGEYVYYEGVEYPHTWSEGYHYDDTHHWHVCLDENCSLKRFGIPESPYEGAAFGEHTPTAGTTICSACGYGAPPPYTEIPSDAILLVGTHFLKDGDYLKADGTVVTEKPEGGYLHVFVDDSGEMPVGVITMHNFTFTHTGNSLLMPILNMQWGIQLEGESTLTARASANVSESAIVDGVAIVYVEAGLFIIGDGKLTLNAKVGIFSIGGVLYIGEGAEVIIRSEGDGIVLNDSFIHLEQATLRISSETADGIDAEDTYILFGDGSTVTIDADDDGIESSYGELNVEKATLSIISGDEGLNLSEVDFDAHNATLTITAGDDAIDAENGDVYLQDVAITLYADDLGMTLYGEDDAFSLEMDGVTLNIEAGDDGLEIDLLSVVSVCDSVFTITAQNNAISLYETELYVTDSQIDLISGSNSFEYAYVELEETKLNVKAQDTALYLYDAEMDIYDSEIRLVSKRDGVYAESESYFDISDSILSVNATGYGIGGAVYFEVYGAALDISIFASIAFYCDDIYLDDEHPLMVNAEHGGHTFYDMDGKFASYVTVRSSEIVFAEINAAIHALNELFENGGTFDEITGAIADVNALLGELTNLEGEGRLDLVEKAVEEIDEAIVALEQALSEAIEELEGELDETKSDLEAAKGDLEDTKEELEATKGDLADTKEDLAEVTASATQSLNGAKAELQAKIDALNEAKEQAKTSRTVAIVIASTALGCNVAIIGLAIFLERKKKLFGTLFSLAKK